MAASVDGGGEVCPHPIGRAMSRPEMSAKRWGMKSARWTRSSARRSVRSSTPLARMASVNWARSSASEALTGGRASSPFKRLLEPEPRIVVGEVEPQRRDRNLVFGESRQIGSVVEPDLAALEHQPVVGKAASVAPLFDPHQFGVALALAGEGDSLDLVGGAGREVHVNEPSWRYAGRQNLANERRGVRSRGVPFDRSPPVYAGIGLRQRNRWDA